MSGLKLKVLPKFPAQVIGRAGIDVTKQNGSYYFDLGYDDFLPPLPAYVPNPNVVALVWNTQTNTYQLVPLTMLGATDPGWASWTPAYSWGVPGSGAATLVTNSARYRQSGSITNFALDVTLSALGTGNSGGLVFTLPVPAVTPQITGAGKEVAVSGKALGVSLADINHGVAHLYDATSFITLGAGSRYQFGGFYQT
jgi:hypothetical protein